MSINRSLELRAQPRGLRRALEEDHAALDLLFEDVRNAIHADAYRRASELWSTFEARLGAHLSLEEEYILPAFSRIDAEESSALFDEHVELRSLLRRIGISLVQHLSHKELAVEFAKRLEAHAEREDALLYRFTERRLDNPHARRRIAARLADAVMSPSPLAAFQDERISQVLAKGSHVEAGDPVYERNMDATTRVLDIMTDQVVVLSEEDNLSRVADGLERFRFRYIPVVDGAKLVGILSQRDVLKSAVSKLDHNLFQEAREARVLEQTFVRDIMQSGVVTIRPEELVQAAAERMLDEGIGALPVVGDAGDVVGIVTETDVLRFVARRRRR